MIHLDQLRELGVLAPFDWHLARCLGKLAGEPRGSVLVGAALASLSLRAGHVCVRLDRVAGQRVHTNDRRPTDLFWPELGPWCDDLRSSPLVSPGSPTRPLVLTRDCRLYLWRYYQHEVRVAELLGTRAESLLPLPADVSTVRSALDRWFPAPLEGGRNWQRVAAELALLRRLFVLAGGPGTGKTFTIARVVRLLAEVTKAAHGRRLRVLLLAPTGKAAALLEQAVEPLLGPERAELLELSASTIHRALGYLPAEGRLRHHAAFPWAVDVVIVDEASMVDLALMHHLLEAVGPTARLGLVGDREQLGSVEAGAGFGELCGPEAKNAYSPELCRQAKELFGDSLPVSSEPRPPLADSVVHLAEPHRFRARRGLELLAEAVRRGDAEAVLGELESGARPELSLLVPEPEAAVPAELLSLLVEGFSPVLAAASVEEALEALGRFRLLCVHRRGPAGTQAVNQLVENLLVRAGLAAPGQTWYRGRPVLVLENDYELELYNGDVGVVVGRPGEWRVAFVSPNGKLRLVSPARLPEHETVYALTVHKSQGSEFDQVVVLLPDTSSPLLTRELFYTAVTRARERVVVCGRPEAIRAALVRRAERWSGLGQILWNPERFPGSVDSGGGLRAR